MSGDNDRGLLGDVAGGFLGALFDDEAAEASQLHVLIGGEGFLYGVHEGFNDSLDSVFVNTSFVGDFVYDFCFSHSFND